MKNRRLMTVIAFLAVLVLLIILFPRGGSPGDSDAATPSRDRRPATATKAVGEPSGTRTKSPAAGRARQALTEHRVGDLPRFILPLTEGRDVTLKGAVRILMETYRETCFRSRTQPLELDFELPEEDTARISFSIERGNFQAVLAHLAALAGHKVAIADLRISFEPVPGSPRRESAMFRAKPGLEEALRNQLQRLGAPAGASLAEMAAAAGLVQAGRELVLSPNGILQSNLTAPEALTLETWLATLPNPTQIKASVRLVHSDQPLAIDPRQATPDQVREWLGTLAQQPGVAVIQIPLVTLRETQEGTAEIIKGDPADWTGSRVVVAAERGGLAILATDTTEYRPDDRAEPGVRDTCQTVLRPGEPHLALIGNRDGAYLYRVLTLGLVEATARTLTGPADGHAVAAPVPGKAGFVVSPHNGKIVDVREIPSGTIVADPTYPPEERKYFRVP